MQISYERLYFQASNQGFKNVRSAYESHISRPQPATRPQDGRNMAVRGGSRAGPAKKHEKHKNTHKNVWGPCAKPTTQLQPAFCAAGSSRPKWLKVPPLSNTPRKGRRIIQICICIYVCTCTFTNAYKCIYICYMCLCLHVLFVS